MAKQRRRKAADASDYQEGARVEGIATQIDKAASSVGAKNGAGHNSNLSDDETRRLVDEAISAKSDMDFAKASYDKANGAYRATLKVIKDKTGKTTQEAVVEWLIEQKIRKAHGDGHVVTGFREKVRIARIMGDQLYTQGTLFDFPEPDTVGTKAERVVPAGMDAELQGQHAAHNQEPLSNNPFIQGTEDFVSFEAGWTNAMAAQEAGDVGGAQATH